MVDLDDDQIRKIVEKEIPEMMGLKNFQPDLFKIFRYQHAIPQYGIESENKMNAVGELETANPGLFLAGNIRDGIGMADRIRQGYMLAKKIAEEGK